MSLTAKRISKFSKTTNRYTESRDLKPEPVKARGAQKPLEEPLIESSIFKDIWRIEEISRRVSIIKRDIIRTLLAPSGHLPNGNDIITHLNVLLQLPTFMFVYRKEGAEFIYQRHFDLDKTKKSRGDLELGEVARTDITDPQPKKLGLNVGNLENTKNNSKRLFKVYDTDYYIRCFLLDTTKSNQPFREVCSSKDASYGQAQVKIRHEYVRLCLSGALQFYGRLDKQYTSGFRSEISKRISKIFSKFEYSEPEKDRLAVTIADEHTANEIREMLDLRESDRNDYTPRDSAGKTLTKIWTNSLRRINRIYEGAEYAATTLKLLGRDDDTFSLPIETNSPNFFLMLRAYNRNGRRAAQSSDNIGGSFRGYAHNVRFEIPDKHCEVLYQYFLELATIGRERYLSEVRAELFSGEGNRHPYGWDFKDDLGDGEAKLEVAYRSIATSLDRWFWNMLKALRREHERKNSDSFNYSDSNIFNKLLSVLSSPVGAESMSMVDPVFYYGSSVYRMPFRRLGGLGRLLGLRRILIEEMKNGRTIVDLSIFNELSRSHKGQENALNKDVKMDCLRVVLFFYWSRLLASRHRALQEYDTKVHLYPIDVAGAVVGVIGKVSFDLRHGGSARDQMLPTSSEMWDQEVLFLSEVVSATKNAIRRQYRDANIGYLRGIFRVYLSDFINSDKGGRRVVTQSELGAWVDSLNAAAERIARISPFPRVYFRIVDLEIFLSMHFKSPHVDLGRKILVIENDQKAPIFRSLTRGSLGIADGFLQQLGVELNDCAAGIFESIHITKQSKQTKHGVLHGNA